MRIRFRPFVVPALVTGLVASLPTGAFAQSADTKPIQRWPSAADRAAAPAPSAGHIAFARSEAIVLPAMPSRQSAVSPDGASQPANGTAPLAAQQRFEQRRSPGGGGNRGGTVRGGGGGGTAGPRVAVPRGSGGVYRGGGARPGRVIVAPRVYGGGYPYYYPYTYSAFYGPGFYDSYWWGSAGWGSAWGPGWGGPGWGGPAWGAYGGYPGYGYGRSFDFGRLRLQVEPRDAEVFVDGYYAGQVDDFDGRFQGLQLETGGYSVEIRKPGWESLTFDVRVTPNRTTSYKGELIPQGVQKP